MFNHRAAGGAGGDTFQRDNIFLMYGLFQRFGVEKYFHTLNI